MSKEKKNVRNESGAWQEQQKKTWWLCCYSSLERAYQLGISACPVTHWHLLSLTGDQHVSSSLCWNVQRAPHVAPTPNAPAPQPRLFSIVPSICSSYVKQLNSSETLMSWLLLPAAVLRLSVSELAEHCCPLWAVAVEAPEFPKTRDQHHDSGVNVSICKKNMFWF